ncbi:MAG: peptidoglycan-binding protein [Chlamydiales bacterium]|nr:peptidoglycan-binding protein [Chlamydiia bacterium]MCP5506811.1 peptidoglycan-binding protein [Chlamydiales bacterium]
MSETTLIILFALLPAAGNFMGALIAESITVTKKTVNRALHAAAGIMLAIVSIEVMPTALQQIPPWLTAFMFMVGGCLYLLVNTWIKSWQNTQVSTGAWMTYVAVAADLIGDGLLIGTGGAVSSSLAFILALGQILADIPEGFAVIGVFRDQGMKRAQRLLLSASFTIMVVGSAILSYLLLRDLDNEIKTASLVCVAGLFCLAAVEDMLGEAHDTIEDTHWSSISFLGGFSLFVIVAGYLG